MANPIVPPPAKQWSYKGIVIHGPHGTREKIKEIFNENGVTSVTTECATEVYLGEWVTIRDSDNPNFNQSFQVSKISGPWQFEFKQDPPDPSPSQGPPLGAIVPDGSLKEPEPLIGGPVCFPGPYAYLIVHHDLIKKIFKEVLIDPRGFWAVAPNTTIRNIMISKNAQADVAVSINQDYFFRMLLQYLPRFPIDCYHRRYAWWPFLPRLFWEPCDPSLHVKLIRPWVSVL
jgi:hypothetical protein